MQNIQSDNGVNKMKTIDMSKYRPFANMTRNCETREIRKKRIVWPAATRKISQDGRFVMRGPERQDAERLAEFWRISYPELYGSIHGWMLSPEEYGGRVALFDQCERDSADCPYAMILCEELKSGNIFAATMLTKFDENLHIEASFFAIHPDYRQGAGGLYIWSEMPSFIEFIRGTGAEYVTVFCETWHNITQYIWFKRMGFKIAGIFPGSYTRWAGGSNEYRGCTVHFYQFLNEGERYSTKPDEWQLIPEVKRLWDFLEEINTQSDNQLLK
jgi:N-acetylglutamate synthase-like GNAT family acetyltransferase